ncbi:MAG: hypothetical protein NTW08_01620 [Gammaproteobacteria bacterium]|nr:hypothetical protein [Gammaproteobacteria bacterium]
MNGITVARTGLAFSTLFLMCSQAMALPFTVSPLSTSVISINSGQPLNFFYSVLNTSTYPLTASFSKGLPAGVSQVTVDPLYPTLCTSPVTLPVGSSCVLEMTINTAVNNAQNANNIELCINVPPGLPPVCQGFSLNLQGSGWTLVGSIDNGSVDGYIEALLANGSTLYAIGHSIDNFSTLRSYLNGAWTTNYQGAAGTTGSGSTFQSMSLINATSGYLGGHNNVYGKVYSVNLSAPTATLTDLNFQNYTFTPSGQTEYPVEVDSVLYSSSNTMLYVGGEVNTDLLNNYGAVYSYNGTTWTNLALENANYVDSLAIAGDNLYAAVIGSGVNFAEVFSYPLAGGSWSDTYLPSGIVEVHSLVADSNGILYAGGYDDFGGTVWKYQSGQWSTLGFFKATAGTDVKSLSVDSNNVLYVAGVTSDFTGGVWTYANGNWSAVNPGSSSFVNAIALVSGTLFSAGQTSTSDQCVWQK